VDIYLLTHVLKTEFANMQAYHNELVSKVSRLEEENIKLKKEKVGRIFHFNQAVFYFFFREHLSTTCTPRGKMKEMAK
jgi:ABA responsive element binding factor